LIYLNNKELIDEQLSNVSDYVNTQLDTTKKITGKYAEDAAACAKATAADLQLKVQGYTQKKTETNGHSKANPATVHAHDSLSNGSSSVSAEFPDVPIDEPSLGDAAQEPILA
jgi:secreted trypsin-like serine protease